MHYSKRNGTSCGGKVVYVTIGECDRAMRKMRSKHRFGTRHRDIQPYPCNACQGYHVTSMTGTDERNRIEANNGRKDDRQTRRVNPYSRSADQNRARLECAGALEHAPA